MFKGIFLLFILCFCYIPTVKALNDNEWYDSSFQYRNVYIINSEFVDENLFDFPVLIYLDSGSVNWSYIQDDLGDLRFIYSSYVYYGELSYEIDSYSINNWSYIWVKIPVIMATIDTIFYMYYGSTIAENGENIIDVWDSNFVLVQHMNDNSIGSGVVVYDDDESFWTVYSSGSGSIDIASSGENTTLQTSGSSCMQFEVSSGTKNNVEFYHLYGSAQDWSNYNYLTVDFYGNNTGAYFYVALLTPDWSNYQFWKILDGYEGWGSHRLFFDNPEYVSGLFNQTNIKQLQCWFSSNIGYFFVDNIRLYEEFDILDSSVNSNDGLKIGINEPLESEGLIGLSQQFNDNGLNDFVSVIDDDSLDFGVNDFTVSFWFKPDELNRLQCLIEHMTAWNNERWDIRQTTYNTIALEFIDNSISKSIYSTSIISLYNWIYISAKRENDNMYLFINGSIENNDSGILTQSFNGSSDLIFGRYALGDSNFLVGKQDEIRISNISYSDSWIKTDYYCQTLQLISLSGIESFGDSSLIIGFFALIIAIFCFVMVITIKEKK